MQSQETIVACRLNEHNFFGKQGAIKALSCIDLDVYRHETVVIVGPSGCGKSTLLSLIAGNYQPTRGTVSVTMPQDNPRIGYVPQAATMLPWRTALQNAAIGLELQTKHSGPPTDDDVQLLRQWFKDFGIEGFEDAEWDSLSGGMKQRVSLICALSIKPGLLMGDEPFSAIDFDTRLILLGRFKELCRRESITSVIVTHDIEEAIFIADRIVVLSQRPGRIIADIPNRLPPDVSDAVKARSLPDFTEMFEEIWSHLKGSCH